ncbi:MAG: DUF4870 domain-containing protein [Patescibacteria group bacterium]
MSEENKKEKTAKESENTSEEAVAEEEISAEESAVTSEAVSDDKVMALLAYLGILIVVPLFVANNRPFVQYHIKQGIVLIIFWVVMMAIGIIPILGWIISFFGFILGLVLMVIGIANAINKKEKPLPIIGQYADKLKN